MALLPALLLTGALVSWPWAEGEPPEAAAPESPIPLVHGSIWEYRESYTEHRDQVDSSEEATTVFRIHRGQKGFYVAQKGGADPTSGPVERGLDWIRLLPWTGEDSLPLPLKVGRVGPGASAGSKGWSVEAEESVTVPAGTFKALRCTIRSWTNLSVLWIVPGVGVVKETQGAPGRRPEIERVLVRWQRGG